jgi:predicted Zn-dependent protease
MNATAGFGSSHGQRRGGVRWWVLIVFAIYAGWYYLSNRQPASFTGRNQLVDTSIEEEVALGLQSYEQVLAESMVRTSGELPGQVREIARRLVAAGPRVEALIAQQQATPTRTPWDAFQWEVNVIESEQVNAFCLPGGKIAVYTGIVPVAQNADALAAVMGHEIAHALLRHGAERMAQHKLVQVGTIAAGLSIGELDPQEQRMVMAALGVGAQYGVLLPFSREHESEADHVGLMLTAGACFDPREAIGLWQRMAETAGGSASPEFMSTHPSSATRIRQLEGWMTRALEIRQAMGCPAS